MSALGRKARTRNLAAAAAAVASAVWLLGIEPAPPGSETVAYLLASLAFVAAGLIASALRPGDCTGAALIVSGVLFAVGSGPVEGDVPWRFTARLALDDAWLPLLAFAALTFPSGRPHDVWDRLLLSAFALVVWGAKPFELAWTPPAADCLSCPPAGNLLFTTPAHFDLLDAQDRYAGVRGALVALALVTIAARWRAASRPLRRLTAPVLVTSWLFALKLLIDDRWLFVKGDIFPPDHLAVGVLPNSLFAIALAGAFVFDLLRARVARAGLTTLVTELGRTTDSGRLRDLLARALGDPDLRLGFWAPQLEAYVDPSGAPLPAPEKDKARTELRADDGPLALLIHDPALLDDRDYVHAVGAAAQLALETERLKAALRAQLEQVRRSRARIVEASDVERRRIERDLHDGAQQRLVSLSLTLRLLESARPEERDVLLTRAEELATSAVDELRDLARGIHPTLLTEAGLPAALRGLAERATVPVMLGDLPDQRLPSLVEVAAYFVCSEAVTNAAKHAKATAVRIEAAAVNGDLRLSVSDDGVGGASLEDGAGGLRGLSDRVEALGGRLEIDSVPGAGTLLVAVFPLALREP